MRFQARAPAIFPLHYAHRVALGFVWRFRHMDCRARLCVRSGGGKSLWCPGSKSHHCCYARAARCRHTG